MNNLKTIFKIYKEIYTLEKKILPTVFVQSIVSSFKPFVNILFTTKVINLLCNSEGFETVLIHITIAIVINFLLIFLCNFLDEYSQNLRSLLLNKENKRIAFKLFGTEYQKLENSEFKELIHKHEEAEKSKWARFPYFVWTTYRFLNGFFVFLISVIVIFPLLKIGFTRTGESFFERPIFLITIIITIFAMTVIILLFAVNINKSYLKANENYAELDRLFYSFIDIFNDYRTGKEIRIYKEQNLIDSIATTKILTDGEKTLRKNSTHTAKASSFVAILGAVVGFGVYLFIGIKGLLGLFGIGSLVLYCGSFMQIINGIMMMANTFGKLQEILPLSKRYFEILETKDEMQYGIKELDLSSNIKIEFKSVFFKYPGSENYALENINLIIHNGEHLAVVGRNGSGKTTFIKLMCRLYDVDSGEILINDTNIKEYSKESLIKLYSVVFQDFKLFAVPLCDNISADEKIDKDKLYRCLEQADIRECVESMCEKDRTYLFKNIDKNGVEISGGESQKLALARALYKNTPVVILDEPTAALDPMAENELYNRFNSFAKNKTAIYISHRLSSCIFCDRIAVFVKGSIINVGKHKELMMQCNEYRNLWNVQAQYYV